MPNMSNTSKASDLIQGNYFQNDNDSLSEIVIYTGACSQKSTKNNPGAPTATDELRSFESPLKRSFEAALMLPLL